MMNFFFSLLIKTNQNNFGKIINFSKFEEGDITTDNHILFPKQFYESTNLISEINTHLQKKAILIHFKQKKNLNLEEIQEYALYDFEISGFVNLKVNTGNEYKIYLDKDSITKSIKGEREKVKKKKII